MRWGMAGLALLLAAACSRVAAAEPAPQQASQAAASPAAVAAAPKLVCNSTATQGGAIICRTAPLATLTLDGNPIATADKDGLAVIGLKRTQGTPALIGVKPVLSDVVLASASIPVAERHDTVSKFTMECAKIAPQSKADQKKAEAAWIKKDKALREFNPPLAPVVIGKPVGSDFGMSSSFGATRTYVPKTKKCEGSTSVHNGTDIAVPTGTEIHAPMAGTVILADPDLFFEGGCVFLDLGRGLVSVTMHMSRINVKAGDKIEAGQLLGLSGATGRVTGPHLHWSIKYRNVHSDDRGTDIWLDPVLMMALK
ncbi:MAG TPA: M23 family metallopeptidase, partial [Hyphomonadaceae bacterium]|nr:M23 family metallopeptidase [Hyphomonadaceae bacterium]